MQPPVIFADTLSAPQAGSTEWVYRSGLIFRAGSYPDKLFEMTPAELVDAAANFTPCDIDLEHVPDNVLTGKLGRLESVRMGDDGETLWGRVALPRWLDDAIGETERKVSATWSRESKRLEGLALTLSPRVPDAVVMSAYAAFADGRHSTPEGQSAMQRIHQVAAESGATCSKSNANMASSHEASAIQQIHDTTTSHGAACSSMSGKSMSPMFGADAPAASAPARMATTTPKEGRMSWKDRLVAAISGMPEDDGTDPPAPAPVAAPVPAPVVQMSAADAEYKAMKQRADAAEAETRRLRQERIAEKAVTFADKQLTEGRAFPAEREAIIAAYEGAATDDVNFGVVSFGEGQTTTRTARLEAAYAARPAHQLTAESLTPALMSVLQGHRDTPAQDANRLATKDEVEALLQFSDAGRQLLASQRGTNSRGQTNGRA